MKFFQMALIPEPLGPLFREARKKRRLSPAEASRLSRIPEGEIVALESDTQPVSDMARLHAVSYARFLGIDPAAIRSSLPPMPRLSNPDRKFLGNMGARPRFDWSLPFKILAPMGKAAAYLVLILMLAGTWSAFRQLARVRSMPWVTVSSRAPSHVIP